MPAFLTLDSVSAATPDGQPLFENLTLAVGAERVGIVGRNGCGKSTLLRIAAGGLDPRSGSVMRAGKTGVLAQDLPETVTIAEALGVTEALACLARITAGEGTEDDLAEADWTLENRIEVALSDIGLPGLALDRRIASLSGGERMRVALARLLIEAPDLLLLDEPTNNLDAEGRAAIAALVRSWRGGLVIASHDRTLLEAMDRIVELAPVGVQQFGGGWSAFVEARDAARQRAEAELNRADDRLRQVRTDVQRQRERKARRDKAGRAFAATGSMPRIDLGLRASTAENSAGRDSNLATRMLGDAETSAADARALVEIVTPLSITLPPSGLPPHRELLAMESVTVAAGPRVLGPWTLEVRGPERIAVTGANGAGKTTLLRAALGTLAPAGGMVRRAEGRIAMLDQHVGLLRADMSVLENVSLNNPALSQEDAHAICARFAFRNRDALQSAGTLSGGERLRAGLATVLSSVRPPWLLILDEPTNHLDLDSIEVLETALKAYDGALLVVSHDKAFLNAIGIAREIAL